MTKFLKILFILIILPLIVLNVLLFARSATIAEEIHNYEQKIAVYKKENSKIESEIYKIQSHTRSASIAAELSFGKYNPPHYTQKPKYALK
jgi:cell division protein FtsL